MKQTLQKWLERAKQLKTEIHALYLACRDPRTPWYAKALAICVVGYAFSPIDLIPDFIPVLGYLDDIILLPMGIWLVVKIIPPDVLTECREKATEDARWRKPKSWFTAALIVLMWLLLAALAIIFFFKNGLIQTMKDNLL